MPHGCRMGVQKKYCVGWKKSDSVQCGLCHLLAKITGVSYLQSESKLFPGQSSLERSQTETAVS